MKKLLSYLGIVAVTAVLLGVSSVPAFADRPEPKVKICHRTDSQSNPYVEETVDQDSVDGDMGNDNGKGDHYVEHTGPVWYEGIADHSWGDIIPPIEGLHAGLNWTTEGQALYNNGCNALVPTPTDDPEIEATPSATPTDDPSPTQNPTATPTATPTQAPNTGGGSNDNLPSDPGPKVEAPKSQGEVLGATTMAGTGVVEDIAMNVVGLAGLLSLTSGVAYAKKATK